MAVGEDVLLGLLGAVFVVCVLAWLMYFMIRLARRDRLDGTDTPAQMLGQRLVVGAGVVVIGLAVFGVARLLGFFR